MQHLLEDLNICHTELGHVLLEMSLLIVILVLELDNLLSQGQLISNGSMECDADVHRKLEIINTDALVIEPFIDEVIQNINIKEGQIVEDLCLLLALDKHLKSIITKIFIAGQINGVIFVVQNSKRSQGLPCGLLGQWLLGPLGHAR